MSSRLTPREVNRARSGPRELKDPRSKEYAIQTLFALKRYLESARIDEQRVRKELSVIDEYRHWKILGYPTKGAFFKTEVGLTLQQIHGKLREHGRPRQDEEKGDNVTLKTSRGNDPQYIMARLQRDGKKDPRKLELLAEIYSGEKSAHAAGIEAGYRRQKTPLEHLLTWWGKASRRERAEFLKATRTTSRANGK
jgi:hypothetical protein